MSKMFDLIPKAIIYENKWYYFACGTSRAWFATQDGELLEIPREHSGYDSFMCSDDSSEDLDVAISRLDDKITEALDAGKISTGGLKKMSKPTQLTQGSDMELRELLLVSDDWSFCNSGGRCQDPGGIYDANLDQHVMSSEDVDLLISRFEAHEQRSIDRAVAEGQIKQQHILLEWANQYRVNDDLLHSAITNGLATLKDELEQQLSPTTNGGEPR